MSARLHLRDRLGLCSAVAATITLAACNLLTGVSSLETEEPSPLSARDGSVVDAAAEDVTVRPALDGSGPVDAPCPPAAATTTILGGATPLASHFQLTPEMNNLAGAIASPTVESLGDFDVSFSYSLTFTSGSTPAAGIAFFVIAASAADLTCRPGPYLCTLGARAPGFAVVLRTSKGVSSDPAVPYVAVVDAQTFPDTQPTNRVDLDPTKAASLVPAQDTALPPASTFHRMAISVRAGKVTVSIDGASILGSVVIPSWIPGQMSTWGIAAATGQGSAFAHRTVVGQVAFDRCP